MRVFQIALLAATILACLIAPALAVDEISGVFEISENGKIVGAERFSISFESNGQVVTESQGTLKEGDNETKDFTRLVLRTLNGPIHSYQREVAIQVLPQALGATYNNSELLIEVQQGTQKREKRLQVTPSTMIADVGVWHHLHLLIQRYSHRVGGEQQFSVAIPAELRLAEPVTLKHLAWEAVSLKNGFFMAHKYFFNRGDVGMIIWADKNGQILKIESPMQGFIAERVKYEGERAAEANPVKIISGDLLYEDVELNTPAGKYSGVLTKPRGLVGRIPALVFLSDSGLQDRDGNSPTANINIGTGAMLDQICKAGFAVLRMDDRGTGDSEGDIARNFLSVQIQDAEALLNFLKTRPDIDASRLALIGLGEGANVAIMTAAKRNDIVSLVLLAPCDVPLSDLAIEQVKNRVQFEQNANPAAWEKSPVVTVLRLAKEKPDLNYTVIGGRPVYLNYYREMMNMTPVDDLKKASAKILHVQGGSDLQVFPKHADGFRKALNGNPRYTFRLFDKLNHFFAPSKGTIGEYADPTAAPDPGFVTYVSDWLKANL